MLCGFNAFAAPGEKTPHRVPVKETSHHNLDALKKIVAAGKKTSISVQISAVNAMLKLPILCSQDWAAFFSCPGSLPV